VTYKRIALVGDTFGITQLLNTIPAEWISCLIAASIRPAYIEDLQKIGKRLGIPVLVQPRCKTDRYQVFLDTIKGFEIELLLCNSYAMMIGKDILNAVAYNAVNIHWALLPQNRGPNPIQWAIIKGEEKTGVTMHYMDTGFDTGDVIAQDEVEIAFEDTWIDVKGKLIQASESLLKEQIPAIVRGSNLRLPQDEKLATRNNRLTEKSPLIHFEKMNDKQIYNLIRAQVHPLKGAYLLQNNQLIRFSEWVPFHKISQLRNQYGR
jgi:methionyl-tRNA formyltransferase